jgi:hypothetical protein
LYPSFENPTTSIAILFRVVGQSENPGGVEGNVVGIINPLVEIY